ncbi:hypothetical protein Tco_0058091 [Tanacetum coccineum]
METECLGAKPQTDQAEHLEEINLNVVIRSNGQKRYFNSSLKEEAMKQKTFYEKSWGDSTQNHIRGPYTNVNTPYDPYLDNRNGKTSNNYDVQEEEEQHEEGQCDLFEDPTQKLLVCKIRRFEMIKYSFGQEEEYVAVKEYEYDDLKNKDACQAY